jgi:hypothetical protein
MTSHLSWIKDMDTVIAIIAALFIGNIIHGILDIPFKNDLKGNEDDPDE